MLGGEPPFGGTTPQNILARKVTDSVPSLQALRNTVPPTLENVVMKALARSPADRFATAEQLSQGLKNPTTVTPVRTYSAGVPVAAPAEAHAAPPSRRRTRWIVGAGAVVTIGIVASLVVLGPSAPTRVANRVVVMPLENRDDDPSARTFATVARNRLTAGLLSTDLIEPVPASTVDRILTSAGANGSPDFVRIADETGATFVVSGYFYTAGDTALVHTEITNASTNQIVQALDERAILRDPQGALDTLTQQVMVALATAVDSSRPGRGRSNDQPPRSDRAYEAYWYRPQYGTETVFRPRGYPRRAGS